jgi:hypothetical protein
MVACCALQPKLENPDETDFPDGSIFYARLRIDLDLDKVRPSDPLFGGRGS